MVNVFEGAGGIAPIWQGMFALNETLSMEKRIVPFASCESSASPPGVVNTRTFPLPSAQARSSFEEKSLNACCETERSSLFCAMPRICDEAASTIASMERKIAKRRSASSDIWAFAREESDGLRAITKLPR